MSKGPPSGYALEIYAIIIMKHSPKSHEVNSAFFPHTLIVNLYRLSVVPITVRW